MTHDLSPDPTPPPVPPTRVLVSLPENLLRKLDAYGTSVGLSRGAVMRIGLAEFLKGRVNGE